VRLPRGSNGVPELYDIDGDGDVDLFLGDASGRIAFFRNDGSRLAPHFVLVSDDYLGRRIGRRAVPRFMNRVLVVGTEQGGLDSTLGVRLPPYSSPVFADIHGTGTPDLFVGGAGGGILYFSAGHPK
jgi:large repetitive protein